MDGVAFTLTTSPLLLLSSNHKDEKKNKYNFLFIAAEFPPDDPLPHRANTNYLYLGWIFCPIFGLILKRL